MRVRDGQGARPFVPGQIDGPVNPVFVIVGLVVVFVQGEAGVGARVNRDFQLPVIRRIRILRRFAARDDRAAPHEHRDRMQRSIVTDGIPRRIAGVRLQVEPVPAGMPGQIDRDGRVGDADPAVPVVEHGARDRMDQQRFAEQVASRLCECAGIVREVHDQRPHHRPSGGGYLPGRGIDVRQQAVPQGDHLQLRIVIPASRFAEMPDFARDFRPVGAEQRTESPELEPARV